MKKLLLPLLLLLTPLPVHAKTLYVSWTSGSDSNNCTTAQSATIGNAKKTLADLLNDGCVASGDTINFHPGTSAEPGFATSTAGRDIPNGIGTGNSYTSPTIIQCLGPGDCIWQQNGANYAISFSNSDQYIIWRSGSGGGTFILDGSDGAPVLSDTTGSFNIRLTGANTHHIKIEGLEMRNSERSNIYSDLNTHDIWITGNYIHNDGTNHLDHGIYMEGDSSLIEYNRFDTITGTCTQFFSNFTASGGTSDNNIFRYNFGKDCDLGGVVIDGSNNQIYHNILYSFGRDSPLLYAGGVTCGYSGSTGNKIYNNTFHAAQGYGITLGQGGNCTTVDVQNNSISSSSQNCIWRPSNGGTVSGTIDHNNCNGNVINTVSVTGITPTSTTTVAPNYINSASPTFDFGLRKNGVDPDSALINAGTLNPPSGLLCNGTCDIGAHETIDTCTAVVPDTAGDNTMVISCTNNNAPPLLPSGTSCSGFSAQKNGLPNAVNTCSRTGNNEITLTLADAYASGNSATFSYSTTTGNVTDSALIGNLYKQSMSAQSTVSADTSQIGGSTPTLTQVSYRFECFGGTEASPDCTKTNNTGIVIPPGASVRVRLLVGNTVAAAGDNGFTLFAQKNGSGGYAAIGNGPCSSTGICFATTGITPPELMAGNTTEKLAGSGTFVAGGVLLNASEVPNVTLATGQDTELLGALSVGSGNSAGDFFDIRVYKPGGTALTAYTQTPRITIGGYTAQIGNR